MSEFLCQRAVVVEEKESMTGLPSLDSASGQSAQPPVACFCFRALGDLEMILQKPPSYLTRGFLRHLERVCQWNDFELVYETIRYIHKCKKKQQENRQQSQSARDDEDKSVKYIY